jgi:hypothetical protein
MLTLQPLKTLWPGGKNGVMRRTHRPILSLAIVASASVGTTAFTTEDGATNNPEEALLVSAGSDGLLRCWSLDPRWWSAIDENNNYNGSDDDDNGGHCRFVIHAGHDCGDIFAMAYHPPTATLYLACKNGSIQWFPMLQRHQMCRQRMRQEWAKRDSRFFSLGNESRHSLEFATGEAVSTATASTFIHESSEEHPAVVGKQHRTYLILENMMLPMAHNGYIYCLLIGRLPHSSADYLFSGSGLCVCLPVDCVFNYLNILNSQVMER